MRNLAKPGEPAVTAAEESGSETKLATVEQRIKLINQATENTILTEGVVHSVISGSGIALVWFLVKVLSQSEAVIFSDAILDSILPSDLVAGWGVKGGIGLAITFMIQVLISTISRERLGENGFTHIVNEAVGVKRMPKKRHLDHNLLVEEVERELEALKKPRIASGSIGAFVHFACIFIETSAIRAILNPVHHSSSMDVVLMCLMEKYPRALWIYWNNKTQERNIAVRDKRATKYFDQIAAITNLSLTQIPGPTISFAFTQQFTSPIPYNLLSQQLAFKINQSGNPKKLELERFQLEFVLKKYYESSALAFDSKSMLLTLPNPRFLTDENKMKARNAYVNRMKSLRQALYMRSNLLEFLRLLLQGIDVNISSLYINDRDSKPMFDLSVKFPEGLLSPEQKLRLIADFCIEFQGEFSEIESYIYFSGDYLNFELPNSVFPLKNAYNIFSKLWEILHDEKYPKALLEELAKKGRKALSIEAADDDKTFEGPFQLEGMLSEKSAKFKKPKGIIVDRNSHPNFFGTPAIEQAPSDDRIEFNGKYYDLKDPSCPFYPLYSRYSDEAIAYIYCSLKKEECADGRSISHFIEHLQRGRATIYNHCTGAGIQKVSYREAQKLGKEKTGIFNRYKKEKYKVEELYAKLHTNHQDRGYLFVEGDGQVSSSDNKSRKVMILNFNSVDFGAHNDNGKSGIVVAREDGLSAYSEVQSKALVH